MLYTILFPAIATALTCYLLRNKKHVEIANLVGALVESFLVLWLCGTVIVSGVIGDGELWRIDELGAYFLAIVAIVGLLASIYSIGYLDHEYKHKEIDLFQIRGYYAMFHVFISMMIFVFLSDNLIIVWIAVEGTTLSSAFLVAFYNKKPAMEAAWKFIIVCSAGIVIALFGTIIMNLNSNVNIGETLLALNWTTLMANASLLDPGLLRLAFILIFVGYATKVGLVPMHTWLPDAHSQAPSPVSATLSGVLLNTAVYAILRYHAVVVKADLMFYGFGFSNSLMMVFGLLSILIPSGFMLVTKDYKRLLAYSSIKHMGMIMIGFAVGNFAGTLALFGALFHVLNHSLTKSMLFFTTGNILLKYKTRNMPDIKGLSYTMPVTAMLFMVGAFALTGLPPFAVFVSEISILSGLVNAAMANPVYFIPMIIYVLCMVLVFAGFISGAGKMVLGKPEHVKTEHENLDLGQNGTDWCPPSERSHDSMKPGEVHRVGTIIIVVMLVTLILLGLFMPSWLDTLLNKLVAYF